MKKEQPVWYCACVMARDGIAVFLYGKKFRSEDRARAAAARIFRVMNSSRLDGHWTVGIGRSFNRDARPSATAWASAGDPTIPLLPPVKG